MHKQKLVVLIISIIGMLCTFMPWVNIPLIGAINGIQGDGWITLTTFAVTAILSLTKDQAAPLKKGQGYLVAGLGGLLFFHALYKIIDFSTGMAQIAQDNPFAEMLDNTVSIGFGLYLLLFAALALPIAVFALFRKKNVHHDLVA